MLFTKSSCSRPLKEAPLSLRKSLRRFNKIREEEVDKEIAYRSKSLTLLAFCSLCSTLEMLETALKCFTRDEVAKERAEGVK
jgi:hypothetical protein